MTRHPGESRDPVTFVQPTEAKSLGNAPHPAACPSGHRLRRCSLRHPASAVRISLRDCVCRIANANAAGGA